MVVEKKKHSLTFPYPATPLGDPPLIPTIPTIPSHPQPSIGAIQLGDVDQGGDALLGTGRNTHLVQTHGQRPRLDLHQQAVDLPHHLGKLLVAPKGNCWWPEKTQSHNAIVNGNDFNSKIVCDCEDIFGCTARLGPEHLEIWGAQVDF